ncbi:MAG: tol-pal system YbgF family protein [Sandaracinaceae bacterium]
MATRGRSAGGVRAPLAVAFAALAGALAMPTPALASEQTDFEEAREAYRNRDWALAVELFEARVGRSILQHQLQQEARKYLGASYYYLGDEERAVAEFRKVLTEEPTANLSSTEFPSDVRAVFNTVREAIRSERERDAELRRQAAETEARRERLRAERRQQAIRELVAAARMPRRIQHDRALAMIPFGVGQLQNGNRSLGVFFLVSEALTLAASAVTFGVYLPTRVRFANGDDPSLASTLTGLAAANYASVGLFLLLAISGVIEANANFVPYHEVPGPEIPRNLLRDLDIDLAVGPSGVHVRGRF